MAQKKSVKKKELRKKEKKSMRVFTFGSVLAIVSIVGFSQLILKSFFNFSIDHYSGFLLLTILGVGFIIQSQPKKLFNSNTGEPVNDITSLVIGALAIISGVLSLPFVQVNHPVVSAIPGIISIIAIIFIILETWVINN
ncbi:MAG: hypothetical protein KC516_03490 [Nanoarchaeota archaeon]|nr:hypothetical protein [Nanoarchaeota archaeon]